MILVQILLLAVGFFMLMKGADWFVEGSAGIAKKMGIPQLVIGLTIVAVIPIIFSGAFGASVSFSGTSLIIIVGVVLETIKQIESQMLVRNYKGFLGE